MSMIVREGDAFCPQNIPKQGGFFKILWDVENKTKILKIFLNAKFFLFPNQGFPTIYLVQTKYTLFVENHYFFRKCLHSP